MCLRRRVAGPVLLLCFAVGCTKGGIDLAHVDGVVTYNGQPVANAGVLFKPAAGPFATGTTDAEGRFTLMTANRPGALVGEHRVGITKSETTTTQVPGERLPRYGTKNFIPEKYASPLTSTLTATVSKNKNDNHFKFDLSGKIGGS